ncbi:MAG: Adenylate kinase [Microgenomates group bacterium GW2011_GWC1_37_8]|uniref:Adenylate kinase n=1 Tax=Candidatus Woesebacteria bacterium GW2011_GWB1_38_8 TaxID=1618570 RepID=A0A0G0L4P4_9BACT|nr:MAG: Adenylate kinase [Microgenomates group bacterium GW2011_GWC1_37_8]KKQ86002.1 MAG: Adenylate kinase [Candidatus Woesebacteria bacterium GW2011_GWB1_38_8]
MNLVLLGAPGSGKGTQAEKLAKKLGLFYLQTGKLSREWAVKNDEIKKIIESGKLIPEKIMTEFVMDYLEKNVPDGKNILFEGFPRFISQFEDYEKWLKSKDQDIEAVISLDLREAEAVKRLSSRRICDKCGEVYNLITNPPPKPNRCKCGGKLLRRKDDNPKSIKVRFKYYEDNTKKLIDFLDKKGQLIRVNAAQPIDFVFEDILRKLGVKNQS